ncbi:hypothetical protein ABTY61_08245 [Kitasatospora sp. NPDC096128]|uniref:hypothetical protein n=1 Tax=Kitasatospora sp. NPDC096128 TaxID=3155547 RepID=UPI00332D4902
MSGTAYVVDEVTAEELDGSVGEFAGLLTATVDGGASVGFLAPLDPDDSAVWWRALVPEVAADPTGALRPTMIFFKSLVR